MRTTVSIPDELFEHAEALARRLDKSRSQVYREALTEYIARRESNAVETALGEVEELSSDRDGWMVEASRRALERNDW